MLTLPKHLTRRLVTLLMLGVTTSPLYAANPQWAPTTATSFNMTTTTNWSPNGSVSGLITEYIDGALNQTPAVLTGGNLTIGEASFLGPTNAFTIDVNGTLTIGNGGVVNSSSVAQKIVTNSTAGSLGDLIFAASASTSTALSPAINYTIGFLAGQSGTLEFQGSSTGFGFVTLNNASTMQIDAGTNTVQLANLNAGATTTVNLGPGGSSNTLVLASTTSSTLSGTVTGAGGITQAGNTPSSVTVGVTSYTGPTVITGTGSIVLTATDAIADSSAVTVNAGTLNLSSLTQNITNLSGAGGSIVMGTGDLTVNQNANGNYIGVISGTGDLIKEGPTVLELSGLNTYTGSTLINNGAVQLGANNAIATSTAVTLTNLEANPGALSMTTFPQTIQNLNGTSGTLILLGTTTLTVNQNASDGIFAGIISDSGSPGGNLIKTGNFTLQLDSANTYIGTTTVAGGTLQAGTNNVIATSSALSMGSSGTFDLNNFNNTIGTLSGSAGAIIEMASTNASPNPILTIKQAANGNFAGSIIDGAGGATGSVVLNGTAGTFLFFSGTNTYSGGTTINTGTLALAGAGSIAGPITVNAAGAFDITNSNTPGATIGDLTGSGTVTLGANALTLGTSNSTTFSGAITSTTGGSIVKQGTGTLTLTGTNTYNGGTTISQGTIALSGAGVLNPAGAMNILSGAFFDISAASANEQIGDLSGAGTVTLGGNTLITGTATPLTTFSGVIQGAGGLKKVGAGTLNLTGTSTYTGDTELNAGTLEINNTAALGATTTTIHVTGPSTLQTDTNMTLVHPIDLKSALKFNTNGNTITENGVISGFGSLEKTGVAGDKLILGGTNTYTGGTKITTGILQGNTNSIQGNIVDNDTLIFNQTIGTGTYQGVISGTGQVQKTGTDTVIFTGTNTYSGGTLVSQGTLQGDTRSLQGNITDNATLTFDQKFDGTFIGAISGTGIINKQGFAELRFNSDQPGFTGTMNVNAGLLTITKIFGGNVVVNPGGVLRGTGTINQNLTINPGGTFRYDVNSFGPNLPINVNGIASISGTLFINFSGPFILGVPPAHVLHANGGVSGQFNNVVDNTSALVTPMVIYSAKDIYLTWLANLAGVSKTTNQQHVAQQLDGINPATATLDELLILNALVNLSPEEARRALDALSGEQYTYITQTNRYINERFNKRIFNAIEALATPCWCPCDCDFIQPWFQVERANATALGDKYAARMHATDLSLSLGAHVPFNKSFVLGGAVNYDYDTLHFHQVGSAQWNVWQGAVYALLQQPLGYLFLDGIIGSGFGKFDRKIQFSYIDRVAKGKPKSHQGYLYTEAGTNFAYCHALIQTYFAGEFGYYKRKAFDETGANSVDLTLPSKLDNTVDSYLGTRLSTTIGPDVAISADFAWHHRYGPNYFGTTNEFIAFGAPFSIRGSKIGNDAVEGSLSVTATFCDNLYLFAEISGERWANWGAYSCDFGISTWW